MKKTLIIVASMLLMNSVIAQDAAPDYVSVGDFNGYPEVTKEAGEQFTKDLVKLLTKQEVKEVKLSVGYSFVKSKGEEMIVDTKPKNGEHVPIQRKSNKIVWVLYTLQDGTCGYLSAQFSQAYDEEKETYKPLRARPLISEIQCACQE